MDSDVEPQNHIITNDWQNREFVIGITNTFGRLARQLNKMGIIWQARIKQMNDRLEAIEKQVMLLEQQRSTKVDNITSDNNNINNTFNNNQ